jgi:hypothetical protein
LYGIRENRSIFRKFVGVQPRAPAYKSNIFAIAKILAKVRGNFLFLRFKFYVSNFLFLKVSSNYFCLFLLVVRQKSIPGILEKFSSFSNVLNLGPSLVLWMQNSAKKLIKNANITNAELNLASRYFFSKVKPVIAVIFIFGFFKRKEMACMQHGSTAWIPL